MINISNNIKNIDDVEVIGISAPGVIDEQANVKSYAAPNIRIMYGTNIIDEIQKRTKKKVSAINDANILGAIINAIREYECKIRAKD